MLISTPLHDVPGQLARSGRPPRRRSIRAFALAAAGMGLVMLGLGLGVGLPAAAQSQRTPSSYNNDPNQPADEEADDMGTVRLQQPRSNSDRASDRNGNNDNSTDANGRRRDRSQDNANTDRSNTDRNGNQREDRRRPIAQPRGEFELFVQKLVGPRPVIRRFGAELVTETEDRNAADFSPLVPADYIVKPGDELLITLWGSVNADLRLKVDRSGQISIPRVGTIQVGGVRYADLPGTVERRVGQTFRNFQASVSLGQLRGVRVYLTGFVQKPGAYSVTSLSTLTQALLAAGGPSAAGSFRNIELRRGGKLEAKFDLYDFLLKGDRNSDRVVQPDDVVHVGPVGPQVALIGSVNRPAVFELKPGETITDVLAMAGGLNTVSDRSRLSIERLDDRSSSRITQISLPEDEKIALRTGDVLRAFSAVDAALPVERQNKRVRIEGEVQRPGEYVLPPSSSIADAIAAAGGMTSAAYVFGTEFRRESVRITQQENYERALRELEIAYTKAATSQRVASAEDAAALTARSTGTSLLVEKLKQLKPTGRIVLQLPPAAKDLPNLALEDGDSLYIPPLTTTVGVFGSVYNAGSYLFTDGATTNDFLQLAGGPTSTADAKGVFIIRANGSVVSSRQRRTWFGGGTVEGVKAQAGDTIFVPDEVDRTTWVQDLKDISQIFYQLGLGAAAVTAVSK